MCVGTTLNGLPISMGLCVIILPNVQDSRIRRTILATSVTLEKTFKMYVLKNLARESGVWCLVAAPYIAVLIDTKTIDSLAFSRQT